MKNKFVEIIWDLFFYCGGLSITGMCALALYGTILSEGFEDSRLQKIYLGWIGAIPLFFWIFGVIIGLVMFVGRFLIQKKKKSA